ncbi:MAG: flavin reductase family protein [Bacteroidales bacterium]|nr:flavin reductase family protein [Bacteroidales bacterium]MEE1064408.1 flavin reductase family protein [Paludibacteraceae bacterium]
MRLTFKPGNMIYPVPAALISCGDDAESYNVFTASWVGTICTNPPMCYVSIRPERHSYQIIKRTGEFVINLTSKSIAKATDWCGVRSGRDYNKFKEAHLTPQKTAVINSVYVEESPVAIECKVREIMKLGSHDMFIADVVNVLADDKYIDKETGKFELDKAELIAYSHGEYYTLGDMIGTFGWSVRKKNKKQRTK